MAKDLDLERLPGGRLHKLLDRFQKRYKIRKQEIPGTKPKLYTQVTTVDNPLDLEDENEKLAMMADLIGLPTLMAGSSDEDSDPFGSISDLEEEKQVDQTPEENAILAESCRIRAKVDIISLVNFVFPMISLHR